MSPEAYAVIMFLLGFITCGGITAIVMYRQNREFAAIMTGVIMACCGISFGLEVGVLLHSHALLYLSAVAAVVATASTAWSTRIFE